MSADLNKLPPVEGEDFYWEGAAMVFTARFLARRGFCCLSGCRHCPYKDRKEERRDESVKKQETR